MSNKWRIGKVSADGSMASIVSDCPQGWVGASSDEVQFYGGFLVAESVTIVNAEKIITLHNAFQDSLKSAIMEQFKQSEEGKNAGF
ncbi:hypothetical protein KQCUZIGB_CDS0061 [Pectobacterium phage Ymer]|uniref:Uncharacterized protein n=1 Tax=Pectobacterium phage Koroua TaxID=3158138 RepID=A0AB39ABN8_9CAUD|nr:hypothetical protein Abuela_27 [Pectobacterium phage Abuela]WCD42814.1 hypothetical protein Ymer_44 [Pectobacterium phage Ymer]